MESRKKPQGPATNRQVNKADKNEIACHSDTIDKSFIDQETIFIEIPKRYEHIIQTVINFCQLRETQKKISDYTEFCYKIKQLWETEIQSQNNPNKIKAEKQGILHPLVYIQIQNKKFFLTKKDILILLEYPFNINYRHILLTLKKLNARTIRGLEPREGIIYQ